jgi:DNA-binding transcriptional LysR family regulator
MLVEEHEFVVLLPENHRFAARPSLRLPELASEPFVIGSEDTFSSFRALVFDLCHSAGFVPKVIQEVSNSNGIFGLVAAGAGVSIYSGSARSIQRKGLAVKPLLGVKQRIPIFAAWLADHPSQALHSFLDLMRVDTATAVRSRESDHMRRPARPPLQAGRFADSESDR